MADDEKPETIVAEEITEPEEDTRVENSAVDSWQPRTDLGRKVKSGEIKDIDDILDAGKTILEVEITDALVPNIEHDLLAVGQAKGKFGGGKRRVFKQTQKKTKEGNKPHFSTLCIVGNKDGYIGLGYGKSKETVPAREKAFRNAKLHVFKIRRGCGSWECMCGEPHSIPYTVEGRCGSTRIKLIPAPKGVGLCVEKECAKVLQLAGVKDVWSRTYGQTRTTMNLMKACEDAMRQLIKTKIQPQHIKALSIQEGKLQEQSAE